MSIAIKAENIGKAYQLGEFSTGTISRDIERWWALLRGKEDPFLRLGETNDRSTKGTSDIVWSLKDINFEINQGDAVGIIGRNGAGKSTLLKVLSRVTSPTIGNIKVKGRIASLLEVGTGFHPELTGRENIYLNGAILGMRKHEITKHFDAIVDFSGVERYIDTPVKRYSSGMYVRLAFAVAAHLESEILIVDEVLAVGDAEFQKKCLGKMGEVSKGEGRTVLFVSHNMGAVRSFCGKSILLKKGIIESIGETSSIIKKYMYDESSEQVKDKNYSHIAGNKSILINDIKILGGYNKSVSINDEFDIKISFEVFNKEDALEFFILIYSDEGDVTMSSFQRDFTELKSYSVSEYENGSVRFKTKIPLLPGNYFVSAGAFNRTGDFVDWVERAESFTVDPNFSNGAAYDNRLGKVVLNGVWSS